jgi:hypothetical protein
LNLPERFFNPGDPDRDFLLLLLELSQSHDLVSDLGKLGRLRHAFAPKCDLGFLQEPFLVLERHPGALATHLERQFAEAGGKEIHA